MYLAMKDLVPCDEGPPSAVEVSHPRCGREKDLMTPFNPRFLNRIHIRELLSKPGYPQHNYV